MNKFDELIGHDLNRKMAEFVHESSKGFDESERRRAEEKRAVSVTTKDELWLMVTKLGPHRCKAEVVSGLPMGVPEIAVEGTDANDCEFHARWAFVGALKKAKLCATQEDARNRASRAEFRFTVGM